jgi:hypothetical protein
MEITTGMRIEWQSQGGHLTGMVKEIKLSLSAGETIEPWLHVTEIQNLKTGVTYKSGVVLHADNGSIKMLKIQPVMG